MSLTFYFAPFSTATTIHWALEELGVPYEKVKMDFTSGGLKKPEFLALNPNAKVPVLVHDGVSVFESAAIMIHLGETFGVDKGLFPAAGPKRGEALKWIVWANVSLGEALSRHQHNSSDRIPAERHNAKAAEVAKEDVARLMSILDGALAGKKFLVGDAFSLVDVHVASWVAYLGMCGFDSAGYASLGPWVKACTDRAGYRTSMSPS